MGSISDPHPLFRFDAPNINSSKQPSVINLIWIKLMDPSVRRLVIFGLVDGLSCTDLFYLVTLIDLAVLLGCILQNLNSIS